MGHKLRDRLAEQANWQRFAIEFRLLMEQAYEQGDMMEVVRCEREVEKAERELEKLGGRMPREIDIDDLVPTDYDSRWEEGF